MKTYAEEKEDYVFYDHQFEGEKIAETIMRRLRFSNAEIETAQVLIRDHMFNLTPDLSKKGVRRLVRRVGAERIRDLLRLRIADRLGNRSNPRTLEPHFKKLVRQIREIERDEECLHVRDLAIGGEDLIARGLKPGPIFREILNDLLEKVLDDPSFNTPEKLNRLVDEWLQMRK
jgi:poly(A) polymerase/tRNA nucleotidyltransferase (CCA-adding enzyme)